MGRTRKKDKHLPPRMQLKNGNYYWTPFVDGKLKWIPLGNDYVQALLKWRDHEGISDGAESVCQLLDNALSVIASKVKVSTLTEFTRANNNLKAAFEGFRPVDVTPSHIAQYMEKRSAQVSANREIAWFSTAWELARRRGWINLPNPATGVKRNKEKKRKRVAKQTEIEALMKPSLPLRDMALITLTTAIRQTDLRLMTRQAIEKGGLRIKPSKTDDSTEVELFFPWTPELRAIIERAKARSNSSIYLFPAMRGKRRGQPYTKNSFVSVYRKYFKKCAVVGLTWHDLRRTAINRLREERGKEAAQLFAGHSSMTTTEGYLTNVGAVEVVPLSWGF